MKKFYGYYDNGNFRVGCSGASVYVYDQNDTELARFKDIKYAYTGAFQVNDAKNDVFSIISFLFSLNPDDEFL